MILSGAGVALSLCQARLKEDPLGFGRLHHSGLAGTALLSAAVFPETTEMAWYNYILSNISNIAKYVILVSNCNNSTQRSKSTQKGVLPYHEIS